MSRPDLPPLDLLAAQKALQDIRALDLLHADIDSVVELYGPVLRGHIVSAPRFQPGLVLYRARTCEKPSRLSELLYPPTSKTGLGRANRPGQPMFYCCTSRAAPFFELRPEPNSTVVVSRWRTTAPLIVNHVGYTAKNFSRLGTKRASAGWSRTPTEHPGGQAQELITEYLADIFCTEIPPEREHEYKLSCAVAHKLCASALFGGLIYPTIQMSANADNFALKPSYVDEHLQFEKAEFIRINRVHDRQKLEVTVLDTAIEVTESKAILWRGRRDQWQLRNKDDMLMFCVENGQFVARDPEGNIVEPT